MRTTLLCFLLLGLCFSSNAQKQGNTWIFGLGAGLDFNSTPPSAFNSGPLVQPFEGTSVISDSSGRLLFWSDGTAAYSRHGMLLNGSALGGHKSSTQSNIIVPKPGSDSLFYVFTADADDQYKSPAKPLGYNYSVVNMCLGWKHKDTILGGVIGGQKNIHLVDSGTEKLCAASDGAGGYWILGHRMYSDSFVAWRLTSAGLSPLVATRIGPRIGGYNPATRLPTTVGQMKFNASGTKVAAISHNVHGDSAALDLFDFDPATGKLSNHCQAIVLSGSNTFCYGVEFAPDNSRVYVSAQGLTNTILQYQLTGNCATFQNSRDTVYQTGTNPGRNRTAMQAGPDGAVYVGAEHTFAKRRMLDRITLKDANAQYDTSVVVYGSWLGLPVVTSPPALVAGFKYHNRLCKCSQPLSIPQESGSVADIRLVPNPADASVSVTVGNQNTNGLTLVITDATGRTVFRSSTFPSQVDLSQQPAGVYFWRINGSKGLAGGGKLVVKH